ncbi:MAG: hypothetical protein JNL01_11240 [Bdellovibrionales bacterium]|nr:hypothetical protein [Bdellovibrionales bacterium]
MKLWVRAFLIFPILFASACSGTRRMPDFQMSQEDLKNPEKLISSACSLGRKASRVDGVVSMKVKSTESSGQFPADVAADATGKLRMEITNLIGGTEAVITVDQGNYKIEVPGKPEQTERGSGIWAGIPLRWAPNLFLGRIPCPDKIAVDGKSLQQPGIVQLKTEAGVQGDAETYIFRWNLKEPAPFPDSLTWERAGTFAQKVDFKFEEFDPETQGPKRWEARSSQGEVKVRWKNRKIK